MHLTLTGVSDDGKRLLLVSDAGVEFTLDLDRRLRAALRGDTARLGQLETTMDSALRPRDIQARIRAGESPEAVAEAAQTTLDRIMAFAGPVLAERQHITERAQRSSIRGRSGDQGVRTLGEAVSAHLHGVSAEPEAVSWDSWRRDDGRWVLTAEYEAVRRSGSARFVFDLPGNYVTLENDDARWLVGEALPEAPVPQDDLQQIRTRRLSAISDELPLGEDAIELVHEEPPAATYVDVPLIEAEDEPPPATDPVAEPVLEEVPVEEELPAEPEPEAEPAPAPPPRRPVKKSRGRASVPSWDEIMFGGGKQE